MMTLIPLIGTVLALVQNLIVLTLGMKEGAIWYAPLGFGGVLLAECATLWAAYICTRRFMRSRQALILAGSTLAILVFGEIALPISTFKVLAQKARRERGLDRIQRGDTRIEIQPSAPGRHRFALTYTLTFPKVGHYLTFPAYIGPPGNRIFGDYDMKSHPEYHDEAFVFDARKPYSFTVVFETGDTQFDFSREPANIDVCDGKDAFMACRIIPIHLDALRDAAGPGPTPDRPVK